MDFSGIDEGHEDGEEALHYYFDHDERIKRAPKIVRDYYEGKGPRPVKGVFKNLVAGKGNRLMLVCVVVLAAFIFVWSFFSDKPNKKTFDGAKASLAAFSFEDDVYASVRLSPDGGRSDGQRETSGAVSVKFFAVDDQGETVLSAEKSERFDGEEISIRAKFPDYDIIKVSAEVVFRGETKTLSSPVDKR